MIGPQHNDGVVFFRTLFERIEQAARFVVEFLDAAAVHQFQAVAGGA